MLHPCPQLSLPEGQHPAKLSGAYPVQQPPVVPHGHQRVCADGPAGRHGRYADAGERGIAAAQQACASCGDNALLMGMHLARGTMPLPAPEHPEGSPMGTRASGETGACTHQPTLGCEVMLHRTLMHWILGCLVKTCAWDGRGGPREGPLPRADGRPVRALMAPQEVAVRQRRADLHGSRL